MSVVRGRGVAVIHPDILATLLADPERAQALTREQVTEVLGQLERLRAFLWAMLSAPPAAAPPPTSASSPDHLLTADEAAVRLGVSRRWIYRKADELPFTRRLSGGTLRFSARGLERWKEGRR
jgi:excisionase family DNA binding protein